MKKKEFSGQFVIIKVNNKGEYTTAKVEKALFTEDVCVPESWERFIILPLPKTSIVPELYR